MPRVSAACALLLLATGVATSGAFVNFESGHVRPLALSPDGSLAASRSTRPTTGSRSTRHPVRRDARGRGAGRPRAGRGRGPHQRRRPHRGVGREPSLRQRQHRRDRSRRRRAARASRARCSSATSRATSSSPAARGTRAFVTAAHRGQNRPGDPQLTTEGIGRADVWAFDADEPRAPRSAARRSRSSSSSATRRARSPRAPTARTVYAAVFHSGNRTTTLLERVVTRQRRPAAAAAGRHAGRAGHRPDRQVRIRRRTLGRRARPQLERAASVLAARPGRLPSSTPTPTRRAGDRSTPVVRRRHGALQHGRAPDEREGLRLQHRGAEPGALRARGCTGTSPRAASRSSTARRATPLHLNPHIDYAVVAGPAVGDRRRASPSRPTWSSRPTARRSTSPRFGSGEGRRLDAAALEAGRSSSRTLDRGRRRPERPRARRRRATGSTS